MLILIVYLLRSNVFVAQGEGLDESAIKKYILAFEKKVTKNQEMRIKFPDEATK